MFLLVAVMLIGAACSKASSPSGTTTTGATTGTTTGATTGTTTGATTGTTTGATSGASGESGGGGTTTINGEKANDHGSADLSGKSMFSIETDSYYFDPTTLKGTAGEKVTLTFKNESSTNHNFTVESQSINLDIDAGQTKTVSVTFPSSGSIEFHCEYHQSLGMVGQLLVS
jgi:plastocyanin